MVREDIVNSAVTFLRDPSVAESPVEKRIAFLQSKNLTSDEIDIALARADAPNSASSSYSPAQQAVAYRQPQYYGPQSYPAQGYWQQPPPELPRRDWRDWFIMATVVGGVSYGVYMTAKRYLLPIISPPTPEQLTSDKNAIDAAFERTTSLLDQLATDTAALKAAEEQRTQRLDTALAEIDAVLDRVKDSSRTRDLEARQLADDVATLRRLIPEAIEKDKEVQDARLKEIGSEVKGLRTLVGNRFGNQQQHQQADKQSTPLVNGSNGSHSQGTSTSEPAATTPPADEADNYEVRTQPAQVQQPSPPANTNPYGRMTNGKAAIPAWQRALSQKSKSQNAKVEDASEAAEKAGATA